ncbi:4-amino-4-deoxy-L-arabinose transferase [Longilinea arvoryzae]|uniref:4-amino-4-deoxy-L-arabinose transferase n=1 Tax=Longilinea arvoryzae TaxID=360412 RepID=A0A0S7BH00_9CHLR|nr:glycosyltransferase family 39 protein [Longilinea arvoryzae]GAP14416.1 4-amino-4-deoxy-L-arabinose transferase [Longilinea arvoryzae]
MNPEKPEPSVLDYLKARLMPWKGAAPEIPPLPQEAESTEPQAETPAPEEQPGPGFFAWVSDRSAGLVLAAALIAQFMLEPPNRNWPVAVGFYALALVLLLGSLWKRTWSLPEIPRSSEIGYSFEILRTPLYICLAFILISFWLFSGNRYSGLNLLAWAITGVALLVAVWLPNEASHTHWQRLVGFIRQREWRLKITPWHILVLLVAVIVIFFRFYRLNQVSGEMFSDHAEKLLDVADLMNGQTKIFFERNTGREDFQFYLTAAIANLFGTGLSFLSLKLGTALAGLFTLPYIYRLGKEIGSRWVGLFAVFLAGIAYWPNVISRIGLRFPLYPLFAAPMLFYLIRGIRRSDRNDFIKSGIALGLALHGYSPSRLLPLVVLAAIGIYLLHRASHGKRAGVVWALVVLVLVSVVVFLPLLRYWSQYPENFAFRAFTRLATTERAYPAPVGLVFLSNLWKALIMPFWDNNNIWVHSVVNRPALDVVTAALFFIGLVLVVVRYIRKRDWLDLFLLVSIPLMMLPSILSLAFPEENPSLNRTGAAYIPIFIIAAIGLESLVSSLLSRASQPGRMVVVILTVALLSISASSNYDLVFRKFDVQFMGGAWNTSQIGQVIRGFAESTGDADHAYVIPYPYWVDTRLVGINAGYPLKDYALPADQIETTLSIDAPKLFILNPADQDSQARLEQVYPQGRLFLYDSGRDGKDFLIYSIP